MAKIIPTFNGIVEQGKLKLNNREMFEKYLQTIQGAVALTVKKKTKPRSTDQNNYYWGVVVQMTADDIGYFPQEMHDAFRWMFLRVEEHGKPPTIRSTSDLTTSEMIEYIEQCRRWASIERGLNIPDPDGYSIV